MDIGLLATCLESLNIECVADSLPSLCEDRFLIQKTYNLCELSLLHKKKIPKLSGLEHTFIISQLLWVRILA